MQRPNPPFLQPPPPPPPPNTHYTVQHFVDSADATLLCNSKKIAFGN